jgi:hypothetical protein
MVGRVELRDDFKEQAEWRHEKAEQYPDDKRLRATVRFCCGVNSRFRFTCGSFGDASIATPYAI